MIAGIGKIGAEGGESLGIADQNDELGELAKRSIRSARR